MPMFSAGSDTTCSRPDEIDVRHAGKPDAENRIAPDQRERALVLTEAHLRRQILALTRDQARIPAFAAGKQQQRANRPHQKKPAILQYGDQAHRRRQPKWADGCRSGRAQAPPSNINAVSQRGRERVRKSCGAISPLARIIIRPAHSDHRRADGAHRLPGHPRSSAVRQSLPDSQTASRSISPRSTLPNHVKMTAMAAPAHAANISQRNTTPSHPRCAHCSPHEEQADAQQISAKRRMKTVGAAVRHAVDEAESPSE